MIPLINELGATATRAGFQIFLQCAALAAVLLLFELFARRRVRAALRYALWTLVLFRLLLPPSLTLPTGIGFWLGRWLVPFEATSATRFTVRITNPRGNTAPPSALTAFEAKATQRAEPVRISIAGALGLVWVAGALSLAAAIVLRERRVRRLLSGSTVATGELLEELRTVSAEIGLRRLPALCLTEANHSPAVYGWRRPVVLLPARMAAELGPEARRDVLRHELIHVRRGDLWINALQTVVQLLWWWNPVVWFVNARLRAVREEAVDERVMLLSAGTDGSNDFPTYPGTLVAVARHFLAKPALSIAFVGILEAPTALERRVRRLLDEPLPRRASLGLPGWLIVGTVALLTLPMASARRLEPASPLVGSEPASVAAPASTDKSPAAHATLKSVNSAQTALEPGALLARQFRVEPNSFRQGLESVIGVPIGASFTNGIGWHPLLRQFFAAVGIEFPNSLADGKPSPAAPPRAFFFNDRSGVLFVRATEPELELIANALEALTVPPSQVTIETVFIEAGRTQLHAAGLDWLLADSGSAPPAGIKAALEPGDPKRRGGILPAGQVRQVIERLTLDPAVQIVSAPKVTTLSGRQAQVQAAQLLEVINSRLGTTNQVPFGPVLDVVPEVSPDEASIRLTVIASLTQFLGYGPAPEKLPLITGSTLHTHAIVGNEQTLALAGPMSPTEAGNTVSDKHLLVFVTPTIVDPAGNSIARVRAKSPSEKKPSR